VQRLCEQLLISGDTVYCLVLAGAADVRAVPGDALPGPSQVKVGFKEVESGGSGKGWLNGSGEWRWIADGRARCIRIHSLTIFTHQLCSCSADCWWPSSLNSIDTPVVLIPLLMSVWMDALPGLAQREPGENDNPI
jgi:hypothetical protein